jgi:hypothetical protein
VNGEDDSAQPPSGGQQSTTRPFERFIVVTAIGLVLVSFVWALRDLPVSHSPLTQSAVPPLTLETIPLVTGDEPLVEMFTRSGCPVCHTIPGISGANGQVGPPLALGTTGERRLKDPHYRGQAKTVHEYIVESVLEPQRFIVPGYPGDTMPSWYGLRLSALALEKMASYLERQIEGHSSP